MKFLIDSDTGDVIDGWIALDNPRTVPRARIEYGHGGLIELSANFERQDVVDLGWALTPHVGFRIDNAVVPDLESQRMLTIREANSLFPIYRRVIEPDHVNRRVLILDDGSMLPGRLKAAFAKNFSMSHTFVDRFPFETTDWILKGFCPSIVVSGKLNYSQNINEIKYRDFFCAALLRNPFEAFAEKILVLRSVSKYSDADLLRNFPYTPSLFPAVDTVRRLAFDNDADLVRSAERLIDAHFELLMDPMTRSITRVANDAATRLDVTNALTIMSTFDLVGLRERLGTFIEMLNELLGREICEAVDVTTPQAVAELSARLSKSPRVGKLLDNDLALYSYAEEAVRSGAAAR
jgi:hypothetical protein